MTYHAQLCYLHYDPSTDMMKPALHPYRGLENPPRILVDGPFVTIYIATDQFFFTKDTFYNLAVEEEQNESE